MTNQRFLYICVPYANSQATHMHTHTTQEWTSMAFQKKSTATLPARKSGSICPPTIHSIGLRYLRLAFRKSQDRNMKIYENFRIVDGKFVATRFCCAMRCWDFSAAAHGGAPTLEEPLKSEPRNKTSSRAVQTWSTKVHQSGMYSSSPSFDRFLLTARKNCQWKPAKMVQQNHDKLRSNQNVHGQVGLVSFSCKVENTGGEGRVCKFAVWGCHYTKHFREGWWLAIYCRIWYDWLKTTQKIWERNREMANLLWSKQWWRSIVVACLRRL